MININVTCRRDGCCTLRRSMSPHFLSVMMSPAVLKSLSGRWWCQEFLCQRQQVTMAVHVLHQEARSSWRLMMGSDEYWSNSAFNTQLPSSVIDSFAADTSWSVVSKQFQRLDPVCLSLFTTLLWSRRRLLWPGALSYHCRSQQQTCLCLNLSKICINSSTIRCYYHMGQLPQIWPNLAKKIWLELDLTGFVKKGACMVHDRAGSLCGDLGTDLPEPELKFGTSVQYALWENFALIFNLFIYRSWSFANSTGILE